jgi:hypothetical protein
MTASAFRTGVLSVVGSIRASIEALEVALQPEPEPEVAQELAACEHPPDARIEFSGQGTEEWQCRLCGFRYEARLVGATA